MEDGTEARFLLELVVDRLHDFGRYIQPGQVQQFEGAHAKTSCLAHQQVDLVVAGGPLFKDSQSLQCTSRARRG